MSHLASAAVGLIHSCEHAGITIAHRDGTVETAAATSDIPARGDKLQQELGEGPCIDAAWDEEIVHCSDLAGDDRWPLWGPRAADELGTRSMLCVQLFTHERKLGALNLYSSRPRAFDVDERTEALALAAHAAVAVAAAQKIDQLDSAIHRRTVIGQATGILMERYTLDAAQAFNVLRRFSQTENRKLYDVAAELVLTRRTPA